MWKRVEGAEMWSGTKPPALLAIHGKDTTNTGTRDQTAHWEALGIYKEMTP